MCRMEQLAHFVTKSFEYNNNRVLDVINMSTRSICGSFIKTCESELMSDADADDDDLDDDSTMDIDITDLSCSGDEMSKSVASELKIATSSATTTSTVKTDDNKYVDMMENGVGVVKNGIICRNTALIKNGGRLHVTKNWLISDSPKRKTEEGTKRNGK